MAILLNTPKPLASPDVPFDRVAVTLQITPSPGSAGRRKLRPAGPSVPTIARWQCGQGADPAAGNHR